MSQNCVGKLRSDVSPFSKTLVSHVDTQIERSEERDLQRLTFFPELEEIFQQHTSRLRSNYLFFAALFAIVLFDLWLTVDWLATRSTFSMAVLLRLSVFTPVALVSLVLVRKSPSTRLRDLCMALLPCLVCCAVLSLTFGKARRAQLERNAAVLLILVVLSAFRFSLGHRVAERMRFLIQLAGSPATTATATQVSQTSFRYTTVSCGVATLSPSSTQDPTLSSTPPTKPFTALNQKGKTGSARLFPAIWWHSSIACAPLTRTKTSVVRINFATQRGSDSLPGYTP